MEPFLAVFRTPASVAIVLTWITLASALSAAEKLSATPASITLENSERRQVNFKLGTAEQSEEKIKLSPLDKDVCAGSLTLKWTEDKSTLTVQAGKLPKGVRSLDCELVAELNTDSTKKAIITISVVEENAGEWESRAVLGFHQAGASSTDSKQNYFFDFFIMRGLGNHARVYQSRFNIWGNVRIASAPQQVDTGAATFIANFAERAGNVPVNKLAQGGEFLTGLGVRVRTWDQGERIRMLEGVAFWGANGAFTDPGNAEGRRIYKTPAQGSQQWQNFNSQFPGVTAPFIGLTAPDRERFYRQWGAGIRITGFEKNRSYAPPSTYLITLGQDQLISGGFYRGAVARADVFYPLPMGKQDGKWQFLYLFGTANLKLSKPSNGVVLALESAAATVNLYDSNVAIISRASARDTYRIGLGIDFVNLFNSWRGK
jgi:hypothetical protein